MRLTYSSCLTGIVSRPGIFRANPTGLSPESSDLTGMSLAGRSLLRQSDRLCPRASVPDSRFALPILPKANLNYGLIGIGNTRTGLRAYAEAAYCRGYAQARQNAFLPSPPFSGREIFNAPILRTMLASRWADVQFLPKGHCFRAGRFPSHQSGGLCPRAGVPNGRTVQKQRRKLRRSSCLPQRQTEASNGA